METPLVSIVTPSYNQAAFLERTICSVLDQGYAALEYAVVDGGSTDGSAAIIARYAPRLSWWVSERDAGQADAINKGLRRARGEIVAWLNSDDVYLPGTIGRVAAAFDRHPDAVLVYGDVSSVDETDRPFHRQTFAPYGLPDLMAFRIISQPAVFMRRSTLDQAGYLDLGYHLLLDHHLWLRMAALGPLVYLPEVLAAARYHAAAKNRARAADFGQEAFRLVTWMRTDVHFATEFSRRERQILAGAHRLDAYYRVEAGQPFEGLRAYWRSFRQHPAAAGRDWKRIGYALLALVGLRRVWDLRVLLRRRFDRSLRSSETKEKP